MKKLLAIACLFVVLIGCEESSITDAITQESPKTVEIREGYHVIENNTDGMARSHSEYISIENGKIAVDPDYFQKNDMHRGDVIYYQTPAIDKIKYPQLNPNEYSIARIIALPGEEFEIKKGQVYVNHKRLDTFYGKALSWGQDEKAYFQHINKPGTVSCDAACQTTMKDYFNMDITSVKVPKDQLFVMGDTWWRSIDSQIFGTLPFDHIKGKVMGYVSKEQRVEPVISKAFVQEHAKIGLTESDIVQTFGTQYLRGNVDNSDVILFDKTREGFNYQRDLNKVAFDAILSKDVTYQLYIIVANSKTLMYSYFYKGENGKVWEYVVNPDGSVLETQVSQ